MVRLEEKKEVKVMAMREVVRSMRFSTVTPGRRAQLSICARRGCFVIVKTDGCGNALGIFYLDGGEINECGRFEERDLVLATEMAELLEEAFGAAMDELEAAWAEEAMAKEMRGQMLWKVLHRDYDADLEKRDWAAIKAMMESSGDLAWAAELAAWNGALDVVRLLAGFIVEHEELVVAPKEEVVRGDGGVRKEELTSTLTCRLERCADIIVAKENKINN